MAKDIYSLKIYMFRQKFKLTKKDQKEIADICHTAVSFTSKHGSEPYLQYQLLKFSLSSLLTVKTKWSKITVQTLSNLEIQNYSEQVNCIRYSGMHCASLNTTNTDGSLIWSTTELKRRYPSSQHGGSTSLSLPTVYSPVNTRHRNTDLNPDEDF